MNDDKNKNDEPWDGVSEADAEYQLNAEKLEVVRKILLNLRTNIDRAVRLLDEGYQGDATLVREKLEEIKNGFLDESATDGEVKVVEGVFDGHQMIGADGQEYQVPPNYASKSKLVEGDILKLTIDGRGNFVYKQIGPIERKRIKAQLNQDGSHQYFAVMGPKRWKLLSAAVTYFRGASGDEVVILVPQSSNSKWAAVENVVKN